MTDSVIPEFAVTIAPVLTGTSIVIGNLHERDTLQMLRTKVAKALEVQRGVVILLNGSELLGPSVFETALADLNICSGSVLNCVKQHAIEVHEGMKIEVLGAGTSCVNGIYTCAKVPGWVSKDVELGLIGPLGFMRDAGLREFISWHAAGIGHEGCSWPSAWYMATHFNSKGIYYLPSEQPNVLPFMDWESYVAEPGSVPGVSLLPQLDLAAPTNM